MKKLRGAFKRELVRPFVYTLSSRFLPALAAALLAEHFWGGPLRSVRAYAFVFLGALFALLAWIAYLRLDGVRLPKLFMLRVDLRKKPQRMYGDLIDYVDEKPPASFSDLEDAEKDACLLGADAVCAAAFLLLSLI